MRAAIVFMCCLFFLLSACSYTVTDSDGRQRQVSRSEYDQLRANHATSRDHFRGEYGTSKAPITPPTTPEP